MTAPTPTPVETGALRLLKELAAQNAREGLASYTESTSLHSMCEELLARRNSHDSLRAALEEAIRAHYDPFYLRDNGRQRAPEEWRDAVNAAKVKP